MSRNLTSPWLPPFGLSLTQPPPTCFLGATDLVGTTVVPGTGPSIPPSFQLTPQLHAPPHGMLAPALPRFNPYEPPPIVPPPSPLKSGSSDSKSTAAPSPRNRPTLHTSSSESNLRPHRDASRSKHVPSGDSRPAEPVRYTRITCASAPGYYRFDYTTGCYCATTRLVELEDRFCSEVLARRLRATAGQPERKPLDRRAWLDPSNHKPKRSASKSETRRRMEFIADNGDNFITSTDCLLSSSDSDVEISSSSCSFAGSRKPRFSSSASASSSLGESGETIHSKYSNKNRRKHKASARFKNCPEECNLPTDHPEACVLGNRLGDGHSIGQRSVRQQREVAYKLSHPNRLHPDIWHNEPHEFNDGPACSCKPKYRIGPLHNQYEGEMMIPLCEQESNNRDRLYHYRIMVSPATNFIQPNPTTIPFNGQEYTFDGFSLFLHYKLNDPSPCQILRFNLLYDIFPVEEDFPELFTVRSLDILTQYLFTELLELLDLSWKPYGVTEGCPVVHLMPRFVRTRDTSLAGSASTEGASSENIGEMLPSSVVLEYLLQEALTPVIDTLELASIQRFNSSQWSSYIAPLRGTLTTFPGKKPSTIRIDQLDRRSLAGEPASGVLIYPLIVHMTYTPMKLSLTREPKYKCVLKNFMKLQYLMMNKPRISPADRAQLAQLANELESMEHSGVHRREITVELSCEGFYRTGIRPDVSQHALNLVSLISHLRFHKSLGSLETRLGYEFKDKSLLHQALTHPSYRRTNFGTNQDHFQNSLVSCGPRIIEYGDKLQLYKAWRKKGLTKMIQVMSVLPKMHEERSNIYGNERLEFLGDAVIEVISSIHLFFMFPDLPEGNLDAYRQAVVQNQHLAELAVRLGIHKFLLYTHSVDFCYDSTFIYARSDAFEALMAAIALDAGLDVVDRVFGAVLFGDEARIHRVWVRIPPHPLQAQFPNGDRSWAANVPMLKKLPVLEERLGITFKCLRLLARSMTIRKTGFNFYTLGDNQRLEFLGDSLLKYVSTDYLFRHFPRHHEGHLSLLKNSLVNKYTQAAVCSELGLDQFVIRREDNNSEKGCADAQLAIGSAQSAANAQTQNVKYKADLLEAFIGALFVDKDLVWVERFCQVCFWPRLVEFILKQEWNDAKSKLQQCCLTFRSLHEDPEIAHYRVLSYSGPTNQRTYSVGVFFRGQRLATGTGRSVQQAQMEAAKRALEIHQDAFRQLDFQRSVISRRYRQPYIDKMLDHVQKWDERLVDYFIEGNNSGPEPSSSSRPAIKRDTAMSDGTDDVMDLFKPNQPNRPPPLKQTSPSSNTSGAALKPQHKRARNHDEISSTEFFHPGELQCDLNPKEATHLKAEVPAELSEDDAMEVDSDSGSSSSIQTDGACVLPSGTLADLLRARR
ncbi:unnamed protein product [Dicrocoelium dendriticum]|nr:unnamed protein product [Dicrocoelium dendriticum]